MAGDEPVPGAGSAEFRAAVAPTVEAIRQLTNAIAAVQIDHGHQPGPSSVAAEEIAAEARHFGRRTVWDGPISDTHTFGGTTLFAASDYARSFAELFAADRLPVYGHLSLARSALEAAVVAAWLNDPGIDPGERVRRGLCEHLYSASELGRLGLEPDAKGRLQRWRHVAAGFGWSVVWDRGKPRVESSQRPSVSAGLDQLLAGDGDRELGKVQWSYLSAVDHGTRYALLPTGVGTTAAGVRIQAACALRAVRKAAAARFTLMGWLDRDWSRASSTAEEHETELMTLAVSDGMPLDVHGPEGVP